MTATATLPRTQVLVRGSHAWRITKHNDRHFEAINNRGVVHRYSNERDCDRFWDFLESVGFKLRQDGWTLSTIKHQVVAAVAAPAATPPAPKWSVANPYRVSDEECERINARFVDK